MADGRLAPDIQPAAVSLSRRRLLGGLALAPALALTGCGGTASTQSQRPTVVEPPNPWLVVVATTPLLGDLVRSIGGDRIEVRTMMPASADPHRFQPGPDDGDVFLDADLIVRFGYDLEPGLNGLLDAAKDITTVTAAEQVPDSALIRDANGAVDPHVWHDPTLWPPVVAQVAQALTDRDHDPAHRQALATRSTTYLNLVGAADAYVQRIAGRIPAERRLLATPRQSFAYFARRYGFENIGIVGPNAVAMPLQADADRFASMLVQRRPMAVFPDVSTPMDALDAAVIQASAQAPVIPIGKMLYGVGMGPDGSYSGSYLGLIRENVNRMLLALGG